MKMEITKEWLEKHAALEGDGEIGAGRRTKTIGLTPEEIAELEELTLNALPEWAQKEIRAYRALTAAPARAAEPMALIEAARAMANDYQTSESHHPNHVLVPLAAFNDLCAALGITIDT